MIASAGFAAPWVGKHEPSATNRFGTPQTLLPASQTESSGAKPILQRCGPIGKLHIRNCGEHVMLGVQRVQFPATGD